MNFLTGDIGGTKSLLSIYRLTNDLEMIHKKRYSSKEWNSLEPMINNFLIRLPSNIKQPEIGCIAVAGPVNDGECTLTNLGWKINQESIKKSLSLKYFELVNDFCVLIYGIPFLKSNQYHQIQSTKEHRSKEGIVSIMGAGTGLGVAKGIISKKNILALASEGGHKEFAPRCNTEWELSKWLKQDLNIHRLSLERIVSGTGLGHIARWRLSQPDAQYHPLTEATKSWQSKESNKLDLPALVSEEAKNGDALMKEVLKIWLSAYGSAVGDLALEELCDAGVWIAGGTASKQLEGLSSNDFLLAMKNKGRFQTYLEKIPVMALVDPDIGLFSAACRARMLIESG